MNVLGGWSQYGNGLSINGGTLSGDIVMGDSDCDAAPGALVLPRHREVRRCTLGKFGAFPSVFVLLLARAGSSIWLRSCRVPGGS